MKIFVINGPNLNMLGIREPEIYGTTSYSKLIDDIQIHADLLGIRMEAYQSNHEGDLVDYIQKAYFDGADGIVINPGAYTHTSIALLDALRAVSLPTVEVHLSNISEREDFRRISYIRPACIQSIVGRGAKGYLDAIDVLFAHLKGDVT